MLWRMQQLLVTTFWVIGLLCPLLGAFATTVDAKKRASFGNNNFAIPTSDRFLNRIYHSLQNLGNFLYIDGGEITFHDAAGIYRSLPDNNTYSIDLTKSWTNDSVDFNLIVKSAPVMNNAALWADRPNQKLYAFGGDQSNALSFAQSPPIPPNQVWRFNPNGNLGSWEKTSPNGMDTLVRPAACSYATGGFAGWALGGYESSRTSSSLAEVDDMIPVPDLVFYNWTTNTWSNRSASGYSQFGTAVFGGATWLPGFGKPGLFAALGGDEPDDTAWTNDAQSLRDFSTVSLYDPFGDKWYQQSTSGTIPTARDRFCTIGLLGDNGTFEIFIYGGHVASPSMAQFSNTTQQQAINQGMDELYVLSIPAFHWIKADYPSTWPRVGHACAAPGRQMFIVGGMNPASPNFSALHTTKDPWLNGIGVFDLTLLQWRSFYDPQLNVYQTSDVIKNWYNTNGPYPSTWGDPFLQTYFTVNASTSASANGGGDPNGQLPSNSTSSSGTSTDTSTSTPTPGASNSASNKGAIAGGVVGGLAGLALLGGALFFFLRRRRRHSRNNAPAELSSDSQPLHSPTTTLTGPNTNQAEKASRPIVEAPTSERYELEASGNWGGDTLTGSLSPVAGARSSDRGTETMSGVSSPHEQNQREPTL